MMVGRFQVMAMLQAARAVALGYSQDEAESFGLNRAIFYAAAKRGFKRGGGAPHPGESRTVNVTPTHHVTQSLQEDAVGSEHAYYVEIGGKKRYVIGDEAIQPEDFRRQVERRLGNAFPQAWEQALQIVKQTGNDVLRSQRRFYEEVYKPRRDELARAWSTQGA
jgi:hypothetical protein